MIGRLLPAEVSTAHALDDSGGADGAGLFPAEEAAIAEAVDRRRREFTTVRVCARRAMARLGLPPVPIVPGVRGAPVWPHGVSGSMTHCAGYRAAAVARTSAVLAVGIDAEPHAALPDGVLAVISRPEEASWVAAGGAGPGVCWDRLLFSAKEAVYKVWYPLTGKELDFGEALVGFHASGGFTVRFLVPGPVVGGRELTGLAGRWAVTQGLVLTALALPAPR
ncbi:4'-phosphopantetheinyl transferase superfamily protein [Streptomyces sp. CAU 1734]|uniref:4'-phosphopantetheinyl transferase family protein n=1 Tax=Streptomyces sp. CAU 1734 TaxID=3140360 RepID=UPI003260A1A9